MHPPSENESRFAESEPRRGTRFRPVHIVGTSFLVLLSVVAIWFHLESLALREVLVDAEAACSAGDFRTAQRLAMEVLQQKPENFRARLVAAKCLHAQNRPRQAVELLSEIPSGQAPHSVEAACLAGDILFLKLYRPSEAEVLYRQALQDDPASLEANDRLAILFAVTGQWWRQIPVRLATARKGGLNGLHLYVMALAEKALANPELADAMRRVSPDDPLVLVAASRLAVEDEHHDQAIRLLTRAVAMSPDLVQAHVLLGTEFFHLGGESRFVEWIRRLPPSADDHPGIWVLRGKWAQRHGHQSVALRCFCEAVERDPNHADALYQAGRLLESMNGSEAAAPFFARAAKLQEFINATKAADTDDALVETERAAKLAELLGNSWEAYGWASIAASHSQSPEWSRQMASRLKPMLSTLPFERTDPNENPARTFDYDRLPLFETIDLETRVDTIDVHHGSTDQFAFRDRAESAGIDFQYFNGSPDVANGTRHMYELMGGGVAVFDLNGDDLPDLYFAQGGSWPPRESNREFLDRLYLNTGSAGFVDVTDACGIVENRFSQGVTVGDLDSDGFADILVANIGQNRLYRNNGDGTFGDMSDDVGFDRSDWTTSCAIVDLSGDAHPELYVVNYLQGADLFTRTCGPQNDGVCLPQHFQAAADRLFFNQGDESFRDVAGLSGFDVAGGKGLGLVVGSFGASPGPQVFIANDTVANFYFENLGSTENGIPRFQEIALVSGLALGDGGTAQGCMGVAAGDADGDGAIDLFVTNFHGETNTLYRQLRNGIFEDVTLEQKLRQPSLSRLGFGTQFLDADLDGRLDLVVANGHIDNFSQDGRVEYQMRPQFFANQGETGFCEVDAKTPGPYFDRRVLGRALARLDWNGDGKEDFVVTHLDAPAALLENITKPVGNNVVLKLRGVYSSRDAIGTVVQVETDHLKLTRQLMAGDGFQASNQRVLTFGLGEDEIIRKLTVTWPSGRSNEFSSVPGNTRWIIIEGKQRLFAAPTN
jgi:tetratricopeptide (TPR) repeat protein